MEQLQAELRQERGGPEPAQNQRPSDVDPSFGLALGRLLDPDTARQALRIQGRLEAAVPSLGYTVTSRWITMGIPYVSWSQLYELRQRDPGRIVVSGPRAMSLAVRARYPADPGPEPADGPSLYGTIPLIGGLALTLGRKNRARRQFSIVQLQVVDPDVAGRLMDEREVVSHAVARPSRPEAAGESQTKRPVFVPLLELSPANAGRDLAALRQAAGQLPEQLELGPLTEYNVAPERTI